MPVLLKLFLCGLFVWRQDVQCAKILFIPENLQSHLQYYSQLMMALVEEGHVCTVLVQSNARVPTRIEGKANITILKYQVEGDKPFANSDAVSNLLVTAGLSNSTYEKMSLFKELGAKMHMHWQKDCEHLLEDTQLFQRMTKEKFDFAFPDITSPHCQFVYPYALDVPYGIFSVPFYPWIYRVPTLFSMVPSTVLGYTDKMNFWQRLTNAFTEISVTTYISASTEYVRKYAPNKEPLTPIQLWQKASLWFLLDDVSISYPRPSMPNTINMADIMAASPTHLPSQYQQFMDKSPKGAILVSFGSYLEHIPDGVIHKICKAVLKMELKIIWKLHKPELCDYPDKVLAVQWLPQNDLLAHPNLRAFLTHGGFNSIIESVSHGVPMVAMPVALDQPGNALRIVNKHLGKMINLADFTAEELYEALRSTLEDNTIREAVKKASEVLTGKPEKPGQRASFWINHVLKHGDQHLRTAAYELNVWQFFMVDVFLCVTLIFVFVVVIVIVCLCSSVRLCQRCLKSRKKEKVN